MIYRSHVLVCAGTGCTSSQSLRIIENFHKKLEETGYDKAVQVIRTGCFGLWTASSLTGWKCRPACPASNQKVFMISGGACFTMRWLQRKLIQS